MIQLGILLAVLGAGCFAVGVSLQHQGVGLVRTGETLRPSSLVALVRIPRWWLGVGTSSIGAVLHAVALGIAPLTVVQPVGVLALGLTALINARLSGRQLSSSAILAIAASTAGVVVFLLLAGGNVNSSVVPDGTELRAALPVALAVVALAIVAATSQGRRRSLSLSTAAGISYGFTALLMRAVAQDFQAGGWGGVSIVAIVGLALAMAMGGWFMQQSYAAGPPQLAVASVTVVDPIVAVVIGVTLLGEAAGIPWWLGLGELLAGAVAIAGVIALANAQTGPARPIGRPVSPPVERVRHPHAAISARLRCRRRPATGVDQTRPGGARRKRRRVLIAAALAVVLVAAGVGAWYLLATQDPPQSFTATSLETGVSLSWEEVDGADGYEVLRADEVLLTTSDTEVVDNSGESGVAYDYSVRALGPLGTSSGASESVQAYAPLRAPEDLNASSSGADVALTWTDVPNATRYEIARDGAVIGQSDIPEFLVRRRRHGHRLSGPTPSPAPLGCGEAAAPRALLRSRLCESEDGQLWISRLPTC